jgi:hypothetical protein
MFRSAVTTPIRFRKLQRAPQHSRERAGAMSLRAVR